MVLEHSLGSAHEDEQLGLVAPAHLVQPEAEVLQRQHQRLALLPDLQRLLLIGLLGPAAAGGAQHVAYAAARAAALALALFGLALLELLVAQHQREHVRLPLPEQRRGRELELNLVRRSHTAETTPPSSPPRRKGLNQPPRRETLYARHF